MISGFVSIKTVFSKIYRDLGINSEIPETDMIEWIAEGLNMIGAYSQLMEESDCITLVNGKAELPCGFYKLVDISYKGLPVYWATNTNAMNYQCDNCNIKVQNDSRALQDAFSFYINDSFIITNILSDSTNPNGDANLCMVYLKYLTDEEGYPMIPDDVYYSKALSSYVTYMIDRQEWRKGKIPDKIKDDSEKDWLFYVNSAKAAANMPGVAQMENLKNITRKLLPITNDYKRLFRNFNRQERINLK